MGSTQISNSSILNVILSFIIIGLVVYVVYFSDSGEYTDKYAKQKSEIDSLTAEFNKLQAQQAIQDSVIRANKDSVLLLHKQVDNKAEEIKDLQNYYGKKIRDIGKYTPTQLDSFFSSRYQGH